MAKQVKKIQALPAQFGAGANTLTKPDARSAHSTTRGVVSMVGEEQGLVREGINALAGGVTDAIEFGKDFSDGFTRAKIEQEQAENINDFLPDSQPEDELTNLGAANSAEERAFSLFNSDEAGDPNAPIGEIAIGAVTEAQKNTKKAISKLNRARTQGRISTEEFIRNSTLITKRAVANNPTLRDEIIGDTKRLFEIAGVRSHIDTLAASKVAAANSRKQIMTSTIKEFEKTNKGPIPLDDTGQPDENAMRQIIFNHDLDGAALTSIKEVNEMDSEKQKLRINTMYKPDEFGQTPMQRATYGVAGGFLQQFSDAAQQIEEKDFQNFITQVKTQGLNLKSSFANDVNSFRGDARIEQTTATLNSQIDNVVSIITNAANKEDAVKASTNLLTLMKNKHYRDATSAFGVNPELLKMQVQAANMIGLPSLIANHPDILASNLKILKGVNAHKRIDVTPENAKQVPVILNAAGAVVEQNPDNPASAEQFSNVTEAAFDATGTLRTDKEQFDYSERLIAEFSNPAIRAGAERLSPQARAKAFHSMSGMLRILDRNLGKDLEAIRNKATVLKVNYFDGDLSFVSPNNPEDAAQATRRFSNRLRNSARAIANLQGREVNDPAVVETLLGLLPNLNDELEDNKAAIRAKTSDRLRRPDGTKKGKDGFLGAQTNSKGETVTERSMEVSFDGNIDLQIPMMVPALTAEEREIVIEDKPVTNEIIDKAIAHAKDRIRQGKSVFKENPSAKGTNVGTGTKKSNSNNPLNLRYGGGSMLFREFPSLNDGLRGAAHQIYRYHTGATTNQKLQTPKTITGLWNNEKEKGSSSASNYLKAVVQFSGLDPNEKIDINDNADMASLMFGMAKAEDHKTRVTERQIRKALEEKEWKEQGKQLQVAEATSEGK